MDIYVGNLPYQADDQKLQELFAQHGTVTSARVIVDKFSGQSKGFGFVEMPRAGEARLAIKGLNARDVGGSRIRVKKAEVHGDSGAAKGPGTADS